MICLSCLCQKLAGWVLLVEPSKVMCFFCLCFLTQAILRWLQIAQILSTLQIHTKRTVHGRCWLLVALNKWCERVMLTVAVAVSPGWRPAKSAAPNIRCGHPKLYYSLEGLGPWSQMVCGTIFRQLNLHGKKYQFCQSFLPKLLHSDSPDPTSTRQSCQTKIGFPCHPISIKKVCIYRICIDR